MPFEKEAMEALEAADQRRKLTDPEHVERLAKTAIVYSEESEGSFRAVYRAMANTLRALSAKLQELVEVKPLGWRDCNHMDAYYTAETHYSEYDVGKDLEGWFWFEHKTDKQGYGLSSLDAAKAAAQAHHDARVRAMLVDRGE